MEPQKQQQLNSKQQTQQNNTQQQNQSQQQNQIESSQQNPSSSLVNQNQQAQQDWQSFGSQQNNQQNIQQLIQQAMQQLQQQSSHNQNSNTNQNKQEEDQEQQQSQSKQPQHIQQQQTLGCQHYLRNCEVQAPCCKIFYTCKLCHDDKYQGPKSAGCKVQRMQFDKVQNIKCLKCNKVQQASIKCKNPQCQITFGKYTCLKCKLYENRSNKINDIFHCDQCKMCRRGKQENYFHCKYCGYCRHISQKNNHKCKQNVGQSQCPICLQVLKYSTKHYQSLPCGHLIHLHCLASYNDINCPVCGMAIQKLSQNRNKQIDQIIQQTKGNLPKQLIDKKVDILCNQCLHKSYQVPFHFLGIKCQGCGTYNTKMI